MLHRLRRSFALIFQSFLVESKTRTYVPRAGGGGAAHGEAAGPGGAGQDGMPAGRFAQETTDPLAYQGIEDNCPERLFGSTNKRNPM